SGLAHLLAAYSSPTPKQAKEPIFATCGQTKQRLNEKNYTVDTDGNLCSLKSPISMKTIIVLLAYISSPAMAQQADWIRKPKEQWPQIAMINEVWYKNGERYIHPSFKYAATGFLIDTGKDTLAVTAKHVLWIAKAKSMNSVDLKDNLQRWIMHPKGNLTDSVVIDKLVNRDSTEILEGPNSTVTQRDWLVFTTQYV